VVVGAATTALYDDTAVRANARYTYRVVSVDHAGNASAASAPYVIQAAPALLPNLASIDIPIQQWIALALPTLGAIPGAMKHIAPSYSPDNGRIYFTGGDFALSPAGDSYRQDTYS
jgi:hypothetical protein